MLPEDDNPFADPSVDMASHHSESSAPAAGPGGDVIAIGGDGVAESGRENATVTVDADENPCCLCRENVPLEVMVVR